MPRNRLSPRLPLITPTQHGDAAQEQADPRAAVHVTVVDAAGLGGGASRAAAGLLHPYNPKGKLVWKGREGFACTLRLAAAAESALAAQRTASGPSESDDACAAQPHASAPEAEHDPVVYRSGILRIGANAKQSWELACNLADAEAAGDNVAAGVPVSAAEALGLVPGLSERCLRAAVTWQDAVRKESPRVQALRARGVRLSVPTIHTEADRTGSATCKIHHRCAESHVIEAPFMPSDRAAQLARQRANVHVCRGP